MAVLSLLTSQNMPYNFKRQNMRIIKYDNKSKKNKNFPL